MSKLLVDIEKELEAIDPEDARHIERALLEMLKIARRKPAAQAQKTGTPYRTQPRALGLKPGLSYDNMASLISAAEGEDWK